MSGTYLLDMATVLRTAGCEVIEVQGWERRARNAGGYQPGRPWAIMWHHSASSPGTSAKSNIDYICYQSQDAPLANLYLHSDGVFWVCAGGTTNTNGKGRPLNFSKGTVPLDSMNSYAIGIEACNSGEGEPWSETMINAYFRGSNALAKAYGLFPSDLCSHQHYAPDRKIDPATASAVQGHWQPKAINSAGSWDVNDMRAEASRRAAPIPTPIPPAGDDDMKQNYYVVTGANARFIGTPTQVFWTGPGTDKVIAAINLQLKEGNLIEVPLTGGPGAFSATWLQGPLPTGDTQYAWNGSEFADRIG